MLISLLLLGPREISLILKLQFCVFSFPPCNLYWPCLLTPTSGGNYKSHERAIDTYSVAIRATKQLLTPTSVPAFLPTALLQAIIPSPIQDGRQAVSVACVKNIKHLSQQNTISGGNKHTASFNTLPYPPHYYTASC